MVVEHYQVTALLRQVECQMVKHQPALLADLDLDHPGRCFCLRLWQVVAEALEGDFCPQI
jgi:hypothetical protein